MPRHCDLVGLDIHVPDGAFVSGLGIERVSDSEVKLLSGICASDDVDFDKMELEDDLTLDITQSGAGGLDTGSEAALTWYYIFVIKNTITKQVSALLSASLTDPVLPEGYTKKRRVASIANDSSSNFFLFDQVVLGRLRRYFYHYPFAMIAGGTAAVYNAFDCSVVVPETQSLVLVEFSMDYIGSGDPIVSGNLRKTGVAYDQFSFKGYKQHSEKLLAMCSSARQMDYKAGTDTSVWVKVHGYDERI